MKKQRVERTGQDMLKAFEYRLYQMKADSSCNPEPVAEEIEASEDEEYHGWRELKSKDVRDSDGFMTEYTLYELEDGGYGCVFGDKDLYNPDTSWLDVSFDTLEEALNWFDNYTGFEDEDDF